MRRRLIWSAALGAALPRTLRAQPATRMRRVAIVMSGAKDDPNSTARIEALRSGLRDLGWTEDVTIRFDIRWLANSPEVAEISVKELVALAPDVIIATGTEALQASHDATKTIPIVFVNVTDPVAGGFVASLARPGGNITGFTPFEYAIGGKWLALLKEIAPGLTRVALLGAKNNHNYSGFVQSFEAAARTRSIEPLAIPIRDADDVTSSLAALSVLPGAGLIVSAATFSNVYRGLIRDLAAKYRLPAIYWARVFVTEGGLMSYGPNSRDTNRQAAGYVDRILKGANPAELPVQEPTAYELAVNLRTAKALGLDPPAQFLARVDDIIDG